MSEWLSSRSVSGLLNLKKGSLERAWADGRIDPHHTKKPGRYRQYLWPEIKATFDLPVEGSEEVGNETYEEYQRLDKMASYKLKDLQIRQKENELIEVEEVHKTWQQGVSIAKTRLLGIPNAAKLQMPHLTARDVKTLEDLIDEALNELANGEVKA